MKKITERDRQAVWVLRWIRKYPGWWHLICTPDDERMNMGMMSKLIRHLEQQQLYELIMVLLMVHRNTGYVRNALYYMTLEVVTENWNGNVKDRQWMIEGILQQLQ